MLWLKGFDGTNFNLFQYILSIYNEINGNILFCIMKKYNNLKVPLIPRFDALELLNLLSTLTTWSSRKSVRIFLEYLISRA